MFLNDIHPMMKTDFLESPMHQPIFLEAVTDEYLDLLADDELKVDNPLCRFMARFIMKQYIDYEDEGGDPLIYCGFEDTDYDYDVSDPIDEILNE